MLLPQLLLCNDLLQESIQKLREAQSLEGDFERVKNLSIEASAGFEELGIDSLLLDSKLSWAVSCYYTRDRDCFKKQVNEALVLAQEVQDSAALIRCYNYLGFNEFGIGNAPKGLDYLNIPFFKSYYSQNSLEESVTNLGSLIDVGLLYTNSLDTVYLYVNKLQELAGKYDDPDVQVVSKFKLAKLFSKALNHDGAIASLKEATPYLPYVDNKGFLHFYYRQMITSFIQLNEPDSALQYINALKSDASYDQDDPRNCLIIYSETSALLKLDTENKYQLSDAFLDCYNQSLSQSNESGRTSVDLLGTMYTMCTYYYNNKNWNSLNETLSSLIEKCIQTKNTSYLSLAYEMQYKLLNQLGDVRGALSSLEKHTELEKSNNQYVFGQSESLIRNQLNYQLTQQENLLLQTENQNQQLIIEKDRREKYMYGLGIMLLAGLVAYYLNALRLGKRRSFELSDIIKSKTSELKDSNEALIKSNNELLESNQELKRFAFLTSHDLKTPLHNILKFVSLLKMKYADSGDEEVQEYLSLISKGGEQMNSLIEDVLEYSQLSNSTNGSSKETAADIYSVITEVTDSISLFIAEKKGIINVDKGMPLLNIERVNLFILLKNLIENGLKYNRASTPTVHINGYREANNYIIQISDNGIGIADEYKDKVFDMFSRLHTHQAYDGSGIGLATCKKIVENLGGSISLQNNSDQGSSFLIILPLSIAIMEQVEHVQELTLNR